MSVSARIRSVFASRKLIVAAAGATAVISALGVAPQQAYAVNYIVNGSFNANSSFFTGSDWWAVSRWQKDIYIGDNKWVHYPNFDSVAFGWDSTQTAGGTSNTAGQERANAVEVQRELHTRNLYGEIVAGQHGTAMYQDIATEPGAVYRVQLRHTSKWPDHADEMQVRIGNTRTQAAINMYRSAPNASGAQQGVGYVGPTFSTRLAPGTGSRDYRYQWCTYYGYYVCPHGQTTTRFTFRSVSGHGGPSDTTGNMVDDITFRTLYPLYYDANGGTGMVPTPVASGVYPGYYEYTGSPINLAQNNTATCKVTRPGYTFMGWSTTKYPAANSPEELAKMTRGYQYTMKQSGTANRVYAVWVKSPSITFKTEYGQTVKAKTTYSYGTKVSAPAAPTLDHQRFDGWIVESGDTGYATTGLTRDTVVVAQYTPLYDVRFFNGVTDEQIGNTQIVPEHGNATVPTVPSNRGYTFVKWDRSATNIIRNTDVTAQYRAHRYQVHYNANGDNVRGLTPNSTHIYDQSKALTINRFVRPGYNFVGWSLSATGYRQYSDQQSVINLTDQDEAVVEMYAIWEEKDPVPIEYRVEFSHEGNVTRKAELVRPATGEPFGSISLEYPGYTFDHWRDGTTWVTRTEENQWIPTRNNDLIHYPNTYIAYFHPHAYEVAYHQNAENVYNNMDNSSHVYDETKELNKNKFVRPGYAFAGWARDSQTSTPEFSDASQVINLTDQDGAIVDLYAIWVPEGGIHVSYASEDVRKGRVTASDEYLMADAVTSVGSTAVPSVGYRFVKWVKNDGAEKTTEHVNADKDHDGIFYEQSYVAYFEQNSYAVRYDKNASEANGYMPEQHFRYEDVKPLDKNTYDRPGYVFQGWSTSPDGSVEYLDGQDVTKLATEDGSTVTLYAVWSSADIVIEYRSEDVSKGEVTLSTEKINPVTGVPQGSSARAARGYKISNWRDTNGTVVSSSANMKPIKSITSGVYESAIYTAYFLPITYSITFNKNAPSATGEMGKMEGLSYGTPAELTPNAYENKGYVFLGWSCDPHSTSAEFADKQVVSNLTDTDEAEVTLYAVWAEQSDAVIKYQVSDEAGGVLDVTSESVAPVSGKPSGSSITVNVGWKFVGWTKLDGTPVGSDELFVPQSEDGMHKSETYVAHVERVTHEVTFIDEVTGEKIAVSDIMHGDDAKMPPVPPEHEGYRFVGFDDDGKNITSDRIIHAKYEKITCTVEFVDNTTGEVIGSIEVPWGSDIDLIEPPDHPGYVFVEWDHNGKGIKDNTRITARYDEVSEPNLDPPVSVPSTPSDESGVADELVDTSVEPNIEETAPTVSNMHDAFPTTALIFAISVIAGIIAVASWRRR